MKQRAIKKQIEMAIIELSVWDDRKEAELVANFGYTPKQVIDRKNTLIAISQQK